MIEILSRKTKNNPVLIGEPGVGKTAIVEGLAWRIMNLTQHGKSAGGDASLGIQKGAVEICGDQQNRFFQQGIHARIVE